MSEEIEPIPPAEAQAIGLLMGRNYRISLECHLRFFRQSAGLNIKEALEQSVERVMEARRPTAEMLARIADTPPQELEWLDLEAVENHKEGQGAVYWQRIKAAAWDELEMGQRGCEAVTSGQNRPVAEARYIVLRESFAAEWQPRSGIEWTLIEQMTQAQTMYQYWLSVAYGRVIKEYSELSQQELRYSLPQVTEQEAQAHAMTMADKWQRIFLRTLRALQNMRRYSPPVIVQNAGQVNVGAQQVNVAQTGQEASNVLPFSEGLSDE